MIVKFSPIAILILSLAGCASEPVQPAAMLTVDPSVRECLGERAIHVLASPDRIEGWDYRNFRPSATTNPRDRGKPEAKAMKIGIAWELSRLLTDPVACSQTAKGCVFRPSAGFRVWRGDRSIEVILCFGCREIHGGDGEGGFVVGFDNSADRFMSLCMRAGLSPATESRLGGK